MLFHARADVLRERLDVLTVELNQPGATPSQAAQERRRRSRGRTMCDGEGRGCSYSGPTMQNRQSPPGWLGRRASGHKSPRDSYSTGRLTPLIDVLHDHIGTLTRRFARRGLRDGFRPPPRGGCLSG
jgi:hypothetical protein